MPSILINPTLLLSPFEEKILIQLLKSQSKPTVFKKNQSFRMMYINDENEKAVYELSLTHSILHWKNRLNGSRYEVISNQKIKADHFNSTILLSEGTLTLRKSNDSLRFKRTTSRLIKKQTHPDNKDANIDIRHISFLENEYTLSKKIPHMHSKEPVLVLVKGSKESYFLMRRLPGIELLDYMSKEGTSHPTLSILEKLNLTLQLVIQLKKQIHDQGVIHNDIKPENILFDPKQLSLYYFDFNLSKDKKESTQNFIGGTMQYVPREAFLGAERDEKSDLYSLGLTLVKLWGEGEDDGDGNMNKFFELSCYEFAFQLIFTGEMYIELDNDIKNDLKSLFSRMLKPLQEARPTSEECIKILQEIKIKYFNSINVKSPGYTLAVEQARFFAEMCNEKIDLFAKKSLKQVMEINLEENLTELKTTLCNYIRMLDPNKEAIQEFAFHVNINALKGFKNQQALLNQTIEIIDEYQNNILALKTLEKEINEYSKTTSTLVKTKLFGILEDIQHALYRPQKDKYHLNLDDLSVLNFKFKGELEDFTYHFDLIKLDHKIQMNPLKNVSIFKPRAEEKTFNGKQQIKRSSSTPFLKM